MSSQDDKVKHRKRMQWKKKERISKMVIKESKPKTTVTDKHGKEHDLNKMNFRDLVEAISEDSP